MSKASANAISLRKQINRCPSVSSIMAKTPLRWLWIPVASAIYTQAIYSTDPAKGHEAKEAWKSTAFKPLKVTPLNRLSRHLLKFVQEP